MPEMLPAPVLRVRGLSVRHALNVQLGDSARRVWARLLEVVARLVRVVEKASDEWNIVDVINCYGPILETRGAMLDEERECAGTTHRLHGLVPSSGKLGRVARILDVVASFCFDGYDAELRVA